MNNVSLVGRLTRDPELRYTQSGTATCRFSLAVDRRLSRERRAEMEASNQPTADFINCVAWGKTAETLANFVTKGRRIGVTGRIQTGSYEREGRMIYTTDVVVENMEFLEPLNNGANTIQRPPLQNQNQGGFNSAYNNNFGGTNSFGQDSGSNDEGYFPIDNDDIPF